MDANDRALLHDPSEVAIHIYPILQFRSNRISFLRKKCCPMRHSFAILAAVCWLLFLGCQSSDPPAAQRAVSDSTSTISAATVYQTMFGTYESIDSYADKAVLYLTYRLDGKAIREPHRWSVGWQSEREFYADLYNAKVRNDGKNLSCYVFDIATGNIDNQEVFVAGQRFGYLLSDPIACHFLNGSSELPLDAIEMHSQNHWVPPTLGFADRSLMPLWLAKPDRMSLVQDDGSAGVACFVLKFEHRERNYYVWVDKDQFKLAQIQFPLQSLDSQILAADQVTDLKLFARFHDATLNPKLDADAFAISQRLAAKQVRKFVSLPEALPSDQIGERVASFELMTLDGDNFELPSDFDTAVMLWVPALGKQQLLQELKAFATAQPGGRSKSYVVCSEDLVNEQNDSFQIEPSLRDAIKSCGAIPLYDPQLRFATALGVKTVPSLIVLDGQKKMQFAKTIDEFKFAEDLTIAVQRIGEGDNVAAEMRLEYQKFLDEYQQQLTAAASDLRRLDKSQPELQWQSSELKRPGFVHMPNGSGSIYVIDGWQTLARFDRLGRLVERWRLDLPEAAAVNRMRSIVCSNGKTYFALYSMLGKQVFVFDDQWNRVFEFDTRIFTDHPGITECQLLDRGGNPNLQVSVLGTDGVFVVDEKQSVSSVDQGPCKGFVQTESDLFTIDKNGRLKRNGQFVVDVEQWKFEVLIPIANKTCLGVARGPSDYVKLFCIGSNKTVWSQAIPSDATSFLGCGNIFQDTFAAFQAGNDMVLVGNGFVDRVATGLTDPPVSFSFLELSPHSRLAVVASETSVVGVRMGKTSNILPASVSRQR